MKILLINPPVENMIQSYAYSDGKQNLDSHDFGNFPPLGILYIAAYLEKYSPEHKIFVIDCVSEKISYDALKEKIKDIKPDVAGITSFSITLIDVVKTAKLIKEINPNTHISMGGHHPMAFPKEAIGLESIDSIIIGDGEHAFYQLTKALCENKPIDDITGIYTKQSIKNIKETGDPDPRFLYNLSLKPAYMEDLDSLPFPARKYLSHIKFFSIVGISKKFTTIISSRGCPYHCIMCDVPYKKYRARSIKNIVDEIEDCMAQGFEEFHFYDDMFNITAERIIEFSNEVLSRKLKFIWDFRGRVNIITKESLLIAKKAGLRMISFGVETGTDEGLKYINKSTTVEQIKNAFKICKELKIKIIADFMLGFPFEKTAADIKKNIEFCYSLNPDYVIFSVLILYPQTPIYNEAVKKNLINPQRWLDFCKNPTKDFYLDYWEEFFTRKELLDMQQKAFERFFLRPGYILKSILNLRTTDELKIKIRGFLTLMKSKFTAKR